MFAPIDRVPGPLPLWGFRAIQLWSVLANQLRAPVPELETVTLWAAGELPPCTAENESEEGDTFSVGVPPPPVTVIVIACVWRTSPEALPVTENW